MSAGMHHSAAVTDSVGEPGTSGATTNSSPIGSAADLRWLYVELTRRDDEPSSLIAGERCLCLRLALLESRVSEIAASGRVLETASTFVSADDAADSEPSLPSQELMSEDWLTGESVVLQRMAQAATSEDPLHLLLFDIYRRWQAEAAAVFPIRTRRDGYGVYDPDRRLHSEAAVIRYALSCSPQRRLPEILGYVRAAVQRMAGLSASGALGGGSSPESDRLSYRARAPESIAGLARELPAIEDATARLLERSAPGSPQREALIARLAAGVALNESLWAQVVTTQRLRQQQCRNPAREFIETLQHKARYAKGHHVSVQLGGRSLDDWFGEEPFDGAAFLEALSCSSWVDRACPERSRLLALLEFDGPMFGIFTDTERSGLRAWLDSLSRSEGAVTPNVRPVSEPGATTDVWSERSDFTFGPMRGQATYSGSDRSVRESTEFIERSSGGRRYLFYRLLNIEQDPAVLPIARDHAAACLAAASCGWALRRTFPYTEQRFADWVERQYRKQLQSPIKPRRTTLLSREAYRFGIEQLAPAILVDGCWLQRVEQLRYAMPQVARRLAAIYADELGDGVYEHNHPHVYRRLLESLQIDLPPVASAEFARYSGFLNSAFDLPVFMLSISLSPHRYLPELLGLNLAIELSGLGVAYSRVAGELDHWGIDSRIVRLHQSIDNLASGHAALARECVMLHVDQVRAFGGEPTVQQHWRRIWTGYRSLNAVSRRFRWHLVVHYAGIAAAKQVRRLPGLGRRSI